MSFLDDDTTEEHEKRIKRCRSCNARIIWLSTENDKNMPVDADTVETDDDLFDPERHTSHFATCPHSSQNRKPRK